MSASSQISYLSKSKLISAWQCQKKLYLEINHPELAHVSAMTESLFTTGHQVGEIAKKVFGSVGGIEIPFSRNVRSMIRDTSDVINQHNNIPIYEATYEYDGVLVRADILVPSEKGWHVIEVKATTSVKEHHEMDCAIQYWVLTNAGLNIVSISLAHINNEFVYKGGADYMGLLVEQDLTSRVKALQGEVEILIQSARATLDNGVAEIPVGRHCGSPYECAFISYCWPKDAEYPVMGLGGGKTKLATWIEAGCRDIRDVDIESITSETQVRIHRVTCTGKPEILDGAKQTIDELAYPRYYLDFETIGPAVPFWAGTRPYSAVPIQWSCHIDDGPTADKPETIRHEEFLDLSGEPPMRLLAEHMIKCLNDSGPILMYTTYEKTVIKNLMEMFPDLTYPLEKIIDRLVDLYPIVKEHYYHPKMMGSWSIKAVTPAIDPLMDYSNLEGINEGMAASDGYLEAIDPKTSVARKAEIEEQLLRYCRFDTEAMIKITQYLSSDQ